ncbi:MAG: hypothetical protein K9G76_07425 [Bacteroidales bacterium]|nr:hypothetical protein [Bacteroidales bacterium]MCF8405903.1 hypothetical protein [Bacteroidales bacterium]
MRNLLFIALFIFGITTLNAQDKTAKDYKIEAADAYKAKDYAKGLTSFEKAIELYEADGKTDTTLYYNAALCAMKIKDYQKSVVLFDQSIGFDYKPCKAKLYKVSALKNLEDYDNMEKLAVEGVETCSKYKSKFNEVLFSHYLKQGLEIFNAAAKMQADVTPLASTDAEKYKAEMEKVKAEFNNSLPLLEKAHEIDPADENCTKALKQAYEILEMTSKAASL